MMLGTGACSHKGHQEVPDVREAALWKGNWVHQESHPSMLSARSLASTSREGGMVGGRKSHEVPQWREGGKRGAWA